MRPRAAAADHSNPLGEINTTPLIDVMLVLLVMLIMTVPPQTHAVKLDLAPPSHVAQPNPLKNELVITRAGALLWNGAAISRPALRQELRLTQQMQPTPELHVRPEASARYGAVDEVLAIIKQEHVEKVGFVGNEAYRGF